MRSTVLLLLSAGIAALPLASCSSAPTLEVPEEVLIEIPVACVDPATRPQRPLLRSEGDLLAMDTYRRTLAAWQDLKRYERYAAELEAVVEGCSRLTR